MTSITAYGHTLAGVISAYRFHEADTFLHYWLGCWFSRMPETLLARPLVRLDARSTAASTAGSPGSRKQCRLGRWFIPDTVCSADVLLV